MIYILESKFQANLIKTLKKEFPNAIVTDNNGNYIQGFPDVTIYVGSKYAQLECKRAANEKHQPNQDFYISKFDGMAFGRFIYPENQSEVLSDLKKYFGE